MKLIKLKVADAQETLLNRFEKWAGVRLKEGRNTVKGYPFDLGKDSSPEWLEFDMVDKDACTDLLKACRRAGFKAKRHGDLEIWIEGN